MIKANKPRNQTRNDRKDGWWKTLLSGIIGALASALILALLTWLVILKQVQQNYDLNVTNQVIEVLLAKDRTLHPLLLDLLDSVKDDSLRFSLIRRVQANPSVSDSIKKEIEIKLLSVGSIGIRDEVTHQVIKNPNRIEKGVILLCAWEDQSALKRIGDLQLFFQAREIEPELKPVYQKWFYEDQWATENNISEIRFNNLNTDFAKGIKSRLDSFPNLGEFVLRNTNIGTPPYGVLIVLPNQVSEK